MQLSLLYNITATSLYSSTHRDCDHAIFITDATSDATFF